MMNAIKAFLMGPEKEAIDETQATHIAVVALLVRAATSDANFGDDERQAIRAIVAEYFKLSDAEVTKLVAAAEDEEAETMDLHRWTQAIKRHYSEEERIGLIEKLWEVVYADGKLDDYEANLLRRVAGLIYVPDRESGQARLRVMSRLGIGSSEEH
ncbi:MAG: TerB family tellurite resistance protein [Rhizobiales bacterium]|nr:TerB family tellurite resistance protein [Hyphomicrobiales bacterium]